MKYILCQHCDVGYWYFVAHVYKVDITCSFQITGALIPLQITHHHSAGIAGVSEGSSNTTPGIFDGLRVIVATVPLIVELLDAIP